MLGLNITLHFLQSTSILLLFFFIALAFFSILTWAMVPYRSLLTPTHSFTPFQSPFSDSVLVSNSTEILTLHVVLFHAFSFLPILTVVISFNSEQQACPSHYNSLPQILYHNFTVPLFSCLKSSTNLIPVSCKFVLGLQIQEANTPFLNVI